MPRLSRFYGLTPADVDAMTWREIDEYLTQAPEIDQAEAQRIAEVAGGG